MNIKINIEELEATFNNFPQSDIKKALGSVVTFLGMMEEKVEKDRKIDWDQVDDAIDQYFIRYLSYVRHLREEKHKDWFLNAYSIKVIERVGDTCAILGKKIDKIKKNAENKDGLKEIEESLSRLKEIYNDVKEKYSSRDKILNSKSLGEINEKIKDYKSEIIKAEDRLPDTKLSGFLIMSLHRVGEKIQTLIAPLISELPHEEFKKYINKLGKELGDDVELKVSRILV